MGRGDVVVMMGGSGDGGSGGWVVMMGVVGDGG